MCQLFALLTVVDSLLLLFTVDSASKSLLVLMATSDSGCEKRRTSNSEFQAPVPRL